MNARDSRSTARGFGFLHLLSAHDRGEPAVTGDHATEWPDEVPIAGADMGDAPSRSLRR